MALLKEIGYACKFTSRVIAPFHIIANVIHPFDFFLIIIIICYNRALRPKQTNKHIYIYIYIYMGQFMYISINFLMF